MPSHFPRAREILDSERVVCWFSQNLDGSDASGKMFPLPIGIDFHPISNRRKWGHSPATPREQEQELHGLRRTMPANADRLLRVHADFHLNQHAAQKLPRVQLWREKLRHALDTLYQGLPVVIVDRWEEITESNLRRWRAQHAGSFAGRETLARLSNQYWIDRARAVFAERVAHTSTVPSLAGRRRETITSRVAPAAGG